MALQPNKLRTLVGTLKDKASLLSSTPPHLAVLRATTHRPSPCHPKHITALLSFGCGSRLTASAAVSSLSSRLLSTHNPVVALKCLLAVHYVILHGAFILQDQLLSYLRPAQGGRNPLNLSGFRCSSLSAAAYVRWYARVLELLLSSFRVLGDFPRRRTDRAEDEVITSSTNGEILAELDVLVAIMEEITRAPEAVEEGLLAEVRRMVEDEGGAVRDEVMVRVMEMRERAAEMGFGEVVEMACQARRMERCRGLTDGDQAVVVELRERVESRGMKVGRDLRRGERFGESDRICWGPVSTNSGVQMRFGSERWAALPALL